MIQEIGFSPHPPRTLQDLSLLIAAAGSGRLDVFRFLVEDVGLDSRNATSQTQGFAFTPYRIACHRVRSSNVIFLC